MKKRPDDPAQKLSPAKIRRSYELCGLGVPAPAAPAQTIYTPYAFTNFVGKPGESGHVDGTGSTARFRVPFGVAMGSAGIVYVADSDNHLIRKVTSAGVVTTLAGSAGQSGSADGTGSVARFNEPEGVAVDNAGNVYVADTGNLTIRRITPAGVVTTLAGSPGQSGNADGNGSAARFGGEPGAGARGVTALVTRIVAEARGEPGGGPRGVTVDRAGNVYVADFWNHTIRRITADGVVTTLAGSAGLGGSADGTGSAARFFHPDGVAVDNAGNVYVPDTFNDTIRRITPAGAVTTLAGIAVQAGSADGIGSAARFHRPTGVAVDGAGNVCVADSGNHRITKGTPVPVLPMPTPGLPGMPAQALRPPPVAQGPVLTGLISLDDPAAGRLQLALFQWVGGPAESVWLGEGERQGQYEVRRIFPATGQVTVWDGARSNSLELKLSNPVAALPTAPAIQLRGPGLPAVLELYQRLAKRTVLRPAGLRPFRLPGLDATLHASTQTEAAAALQGLINSNGLVVVPESDKFAFVVYPAMTNALPRFERAAALARAVPPALPPPPQPQQYPSVVDMDAQRLMEWYAPYTRRQPLPLAANFPVVKSSVRIQSSLDQAETIFLLEALAELNGAAFELVGTNQFRLVTKGNRIMQGVPGVPGARPMRK